MPTQILFGGPVIKSLHESEDFVVVNESGSYGVTGSTLGVTTVKDVIFNTETTATTRNVRDLHLVARLDDPNPVTIKNLTPTVCKIDAEGHMLALGTSGTCTIEFASRHTRRRITQTISTTGAAVLYKSFAGSVAGSLRAYLYDQQVAALAEVTPGSAYQRAGLHGNGIAAGLDSTVAMPGSYGGVNTANFIRAQGKAGFDGFDLPLLDQVLDSGHSGNGAGWRAWISPNHFLTWRGHGVGNSASWRAISGEIIVEYSATPWAGGLAKVLPAMYNPKLTLLPSNWSVLGTGISCWMRAFNTYDNLSDTTAQRRWVQPADYHKSFFGSTDTRKTFQRFKSNGTLANGGDSGSPLFCGIKEGANPLATLVMVSHLQRETQIGTLFYADYISAINTAMAELSALNASPTYTVGQVDLSAFTTF